MFKPERLTTLCDGVIAIAITLLVLGLEVPSVHSVPEQKLTPYLIDSSRALVGYVGSFLLIGTYWLQHYVAFHYVIRVDRVFIALNGIFLLCVSFVPFPTGLQASYRHDELAMILYSLTQAACGLSMLAVWLYATKNHRLVKDDVPPELVKAMTRRLAVTPVVGVAAIVVSFVNIDLSHLLFLIIPAAFLSHRAVDRV